MLKIQGFHSLISFHVFFGIAKMNSKQRIIDQFNIITRLLIKRSIIKTSTAKLVQKFYRNSCRNSTKARVEILQKFVQKFYSKSCRNFTEIRVEIHAEILQIFVQKFYQRSCRNFIAGVQLSERGHHPSASWDPPP